MRNFFIALWELYRIVVGVVAIVLLVLYFVILAPYRHGSSAAPFSSLPVPSGAGANDSSQGQNPARE
jgi:hypothetical protein